MINILVTGSRGQLGMSIASLKNKYSNYNFFFTDKTSLNILNFNEVEDFIVKNKIHVLVNCAAYTNVEKAEDEKELANKINHLAVKNLAEVSKKHQLKFIHISTDYVFDGNSSIPYCENNETNPQNYYGVSKLNGENALLKVNPSNSIIIRTSWLCSSFQSNFVKTILKLCKKKEVISVVSNQIGSPTFANDLATVILQIVPKINFENTEIFHYTNKGKCSWFQFAQEIVKQSKQPCKVEPVLAKDFKSKVNRPDFSLLDTEKITKTFQINIPHWKDSLTKCIGKLKVENET